MEGEAVKDFKVKMEPWREPWKEGEGGARHRLIWLESSVIWL